MARPGMQRAATARQASSPLPWARHHARRANTARSSLSLARFHAGSARSVRLARSAPTAAVMSPGRARNVHLASSSLTLARRGMQLAVHAPLVSTRMSWDRLLAKHAHRAQRGSIALVAEAPRRACVWRARRANLRHPPATGTRNALNVLRAKSQPLRGRLAAQTAASVSSRKQMGNQAASLAQRAVGGLSAQGAHWQPAAHAPTALMAAGRLVT